MSIEGILIILFYNSLAIGAFYIFFGIIARRASKRLRAASLRLGAMMDKSVGDEFDTLVRKVGVRAELTFWLLLIITLILLVAGFAVYAQSVEPEANLMTWLFMYVVLGGVGFLGAMLILGNLIATDVQLMVANKFLRQQEAKHPHSPVLDDVKGMLRVRVGEHGVSVLSFAALIASGLSGLVVLAVLFTAAQTAIECARSSKCL